MEHTNGTYRPTIGLEVHAEMKTYTKMFCSCANSPHKSQPNTHICPVCMGHPGTLPVVNETAVKNVLRVGVALGGSLASFTEFDRKNYFYPDIPKGYQISQYAHPLVSGGSLCGVAITRIHLEEDTARSSHEQSDGSLIDYNRAGVPLMELVTEPTIHDVETAQLFARELQLLLRALGVSDANMEKGEMRIEANISVSPDETFGTKVEIKNLNSFRALEGAILFEIDRQIDLLRKGDFVVQETRGWDESRNRTFSQRLKETADDYRYFGDPDIPKLNLSEIGKYSLSRLKDSLPPLPQEVRIKYRDLGLASEQVEILAFDNRVSEFFSLLVKETEEKEIIKLSGNYLSSDVMVLVGDRVLPKNSLVKFLELMKLSSQKKITSRVTKDMLPLVLFDGVDPVQHAEMNQLLQNNNEDELGIIARQIINQHEAVVNDYRIGKENALQYLIGLGMKATRGAANPSVLKEVFKQEITK